MKRLAIVSACLLLLLAAAALWIARSAWLREQVRAGIVTQAEETTGGRVELGTFRFDWRTLTAECDHFVIHGTEPAGDAPLLAIERLIVGLRIISLLRRDVRLEHIEADRPQAHLIVYPGGGTNLPRPKINLRGSLPETILDLKIARFDLRDGLVLVDGQTPKPWDAQGRNLAVRLTYDAAGARYAGDIAIAPLRLLSTDWQVAASAAMEKNRVLIPHAVLKTAASEIDLTNVALTGFHAPVVTASYNARVSLSEAAALLQLKTRQAGSVTTAGEARFVSLADYRVTGMAGGSGIDFDRLHNIRATSTFEAVPGKMSFAGIRANVLGGELTGAAEVRDFDTFHATGHLARFDLRQVAALDTSRPLPYDGVVSGPFEATGQIHDMSRPLVTVTTQATVSPAATGAPVHGEVALHYDAVAKRVDLGHSWLELPNTRLEVAGTLGGRLDVKLHSQDFAELAPAVDMVAAGRPIPALQYESLDFDGRVTGPLTNPLIAGKASARNLDYRGTRVESLAGDFTASAGGATVSGGSIDAADIHARGAGSLGLSDWKASPSSSLTATVQIADADLTRILALAGHKEIDLKGTVNGSAQITGTLGDPNGNGDLAVTKGSIYEQPFDSITAHAQFLNRTTQALTGLFVSGPKRVNISARFDHAGTRFPAGKLAFNLTSNTMPLNQIALVRARQPDIHGFGEFHADGELELSHDAQHNLQFDLLSLNATGSVNTVELGGRNLGDARGSAQTRDGVLTARFDSNAAKAVIHGEGTMGLTGDYPVNGKLTFSNAGLNALAALIVTESEASSLNFDGSGEGTVTITGFAKKPDQLSAAVEVRKLELHPLPNTDFARSLPNFVATNSGPVRAVVTKSQIRIESAHLTAPQTDVSIDGSIALTGQAPLNLRAQGTVNLALARTISPDVTSSGSLALNATMRGDWKTPDFSGRASIRSADIHFTDFSNGLTNANGDFIFSGTHATIQSFTAESGGGKVDAGGFVALANGILAFRIEARAHEVRVRYPEGVSSISDATLTFAGSSQRSEASGVVTVHRIAINPRFDTANILASSAEPLRAPSGGAGLLANLNLDIQISTAPDAAFETSVTQSLQADANLRLRGTATNPALIGRINITQGELIFFGNKYSINGGTISFFDPVRIDPVLNVDLETKARGVDVTLTITGSATRPLNVSFRSDPPLQYSDILALLATGRTPSDPTLAVRESSQGQNFQQLGASTLIGQALANPATSRLQRFFGVSRLKIDPALTGVTGSPEARLTIEQQVTPEILFTYITDVSSTSTQLFRAEWSFNRHWSAILIRDENGYVGLDFAYKKRFK